MEKAKKRSAMKPATERMRVLAEGLRAELEQWPGVAMKRSFGMILAYRGKVIFGALPDTRMIYHEEAIMLKFAQQKPALVKRIEGEPRIVAGTMGKARNGESRKWRFFLIQEDKDVHAAIEWLAEAYQLARGRKGKPEAPANET
jgi:hypothetical protein